MKGIGIMAVLMCVLSSPLLAGSEPGDRVALRQHLGDTLPLQRNFIDDKGRSVVLKRYFDDRPVLLLFAYYDCPNLCDTVLAGAFQAVADTGLVAGEDYELVVIGIDPRETILQAADKKRRLVGRYKLEDGAGHIHFLTGTEPAIQAVADAAGFQYRYEPDLQQYAHAAGVLVVSPQGRLSRYLYGVRYKARELRLALVQAGDNRIGSAVDRLLLLCFQYNPETGKYGVLIMNVLRLGAGLAVLALGGFIGLMLWREHRRRLQV